MRKAIIVVLAFNVSAVCAGRVWAEWQTFGVAEGLPYENVRAIFEDSSGALWFCTSGVTRYDGFSWITYDMLDWFGSNLVSQVIEDRAGNIWLAVYGGVAMYDGHSWTTYTTDDGLVHKYAKSVCEDPHGNIWVGTFGGVSRYDGTNWRTYTTEDGLASNDVRRILRDRDGVLWFGTAGGVTRYDGVNWKTYTVADGMAGNTIRAITEDSAGNLWFGTFDGLSCYDGAGWTTFTTADGLADNNVAAICEDDLGHLWFGTPEGVTRYDGTRWITYTIADGLPDNTVVAIIQDSSGNLWFGTYEGAARYDRADWRVYTKDDGLAATGASCVIQDRSGNMWFGTKGYGVSRFDGTVWTTFTTTEGLAYDGVATILEDSSGNLWIGTYYGGVSKYDGVNWETYGRDVLMTGWVEDICEDSAGNIWLATNNGAARYDGIGWTRYYYELSDHRVRTIIEDSSGSLWFGTVGGGVNRYDGTAWSSFTTEDGLASNNVASILEDSSGALWFGTREGVSRYEGSVWTTYTKDDGLVHNDVMDIIEDRTGLLWFATYGGGVAVYDGVRWGRLTAADGLGGNYVNDICEARSGTIWFAHDVGGVTAHEPDRVRPQTVFTMRPPAVSASTMQSVGFSAAFGEIGSVTFSHSVDGSPWSEWSSAGFWTGQGLSDGLHTFAVRARDLVGNVDSTPAVCSFEVDATPPEPVIESPAFGRAVRDSIVIIGTADDLRFNSYWIEVGRVGVLSPELLLESSDPVPDGTLGGWNTTALPDGDYELRLSVADTLGLTGTYLVRVTVDNEAPWAYQTAPAIVMPANGGDVYTTDGEVHLYFPPGGFDREARVTIEELSESDVPDTLADGAHKAAVGYEISWEGAPLLKPGTLELSYDGLETELSSDDLAIYVSLADSSWRRLGGTVDAVAKCIALPVTQAGLYSLFTDGDYSSGTRSLLGLSVTPRVFSPSGGFAACEAAIGFTLGRPGPATVKVYNRAGRLVREVIAGEQMNGGANLVRWDGRDGDGEIVEDGVYLVTVEALGARQVKPLAVVR